MNTLSRAITSQLFPHSDTSLALRRQWSALINSERKHELTAAQHLLYLALCGKDWRQGFTLASNRRKLANGAYLDWALWRALDRIHYPIYESALLAPFAGSVTREMLAQIRVWLPKSNASAYQPEQFADRQFPFEAYSVSVETRFHETLETH